MDLPHQLVHTQIAIEHKWVRQNNRVEAVFDEHLIEHQKRHRALVPVVKEVSDLQGPAGSSDDALLLKIGVGTVDGGVVLFQDALVSLRWFVPALWLSPARQSQQASTLDQ